MQYELSVTDETHRNIRFGKCQSVNHRGNGVSFGDVFFEKFHACGGVVEKIADNDRGAFGTTGIVKKFFFAAVDKVFAPDVLVFGTCEHFHPCHGGNGGQRFSAEAESSDAIEIVFGLNLAGGMADEGGGHIVLSDAAAVIGHAHITDTAVLNFHSHRGRSGVHGVFRQLFDDGTGAIDDLSGGNQFGNMFVQDVNRVHRNSPFGQSACAIFFRRSSTLSASIGVRICGSMLSSS